MRNQGTSARPGGGDSPRGPNPSGCRSERPEHAVAREAAESWTGLEGGLNHKALLDMLEISAVAESLSLRKQHISYMRCIFRKARPDDFAPGDWPPVVWMTKSKIAGDLGLKPRAVSNIEDDLARAGFIYWTDSASRRRNGWRDPETGRIACAYGVNLAPFAARADEIEATFRAVQQERKDCQALVYEIAAIRTRTLVRLKAAFRSGAAGDASIPELLDKAAALPTGRTMACWRLTPLEELAAEARAIEARAKAVTRPDQAGETSPPTQGNSSEICTLGCTPESGSITITNQYQDSNLAAADRTAEPKPDTQPAAARPWPERGDCSREAAGEAPPAKFPPAWLILESLPASFAQHLPDRTMPNAEDFRIAANFARSRLGVSPSAWREACEVMGPDAASFAVAVVASRADAGEVRSAGGYLRGMVAAARKGELDLGRSLWGLVGRADEATSQPDEASQLPVQAEIAATTPDHAFAGAGSEDEEASFSGEAPSNTPAPALEDIEPIIPWSIRRCLTSSPDSPRRWLHLMHATLTVCTGRLSVSGSAWRGAMDTLGLHRTTAIGIILAAITERHPDPDSADAETVFLHLVREEAVRPGSVIEHVRLLQRENRDDSRLDPVPPQSRSRHPWRDSPP